MTKKLTRNGERKQQQLSYLSRVEKWESHFHLNRRLSLYQVNLSYLHSPPRFQSLKLEFSLIAFFFFQFQRTKKEKDKSTYIQDLYTHQFSRKAEVVEELPGEPDTAEGTRWHCRVERLKVLLMLGCLRV